MLVATPSIRNCASACDALRMTPATSGLRAWTISLASSESNAVVVR